MRIVKEAEERRNEILDAADELFGEKGFDGTSTNDILEKVKIARGTMYYHFKSKEDIMDALIARYHAHLLSAAQAAASDRSKSIHERILHTVMAMKISGGNGGEIIEHIHKPQNALMHQKIQKAIVSDITPILAEIIREGTRQELFDTPFPYECMEMLVVYANTIFDDEMVELTEEELASRIQAFIFNAERMLGAEHGSFGYGMQMFGGGNESSENESSKIESSKIESSKIESNENKDVGNGGGYE